MDIISSGGHNKVPKFHMGPRFEARPLSGLGEGPAEKKGFWRGQGAVLVGVGVFALLLMWLDSRSKK